jgi:hypothetical protein
MPDDRSQTSPASSSQSDPQIIRKDRDREPPPQPSVGNGDTPLILDKPRGLGEEK